MNAKVDALMQKAKFHLSGWLALFLCLTLFTLVLSACGSSSQADTPPVPKPKPMSVFKGNGFITSYSPSDWTFQQTKTISGLVANKDSAEIFTVNSLNTQGKKANLDDALNAAMATIKIAGKNYKEDPSAPATTKIGGEDWKQKAATMDTNNKGKMVSLKIYSLAVQHGNMSYLMTCSLIAGTADADMKNLVQPVLDSYKFI